MNNHQGLKAEIDARDENFTIAVNLGKDLIQRKHEMAPTVRGVFCCIFLTITLEGRTPRDNLKFCYCLQAVECIILWHHPFVSAYLCQIKRHFKIIVVVHSFTSCALNLVKVVLQGYRNKGLKNNLASNCRYPY
jgi:hypothetical protein